MPDGFEARLRLLDPSLVVGKWRPASPVVAQHPELRGKWRWCIYQCVRHFSATAAHTEACARAGAYVWMVQTPNGDFMPLGDRVLDKVREIDQLRAGYTLDARGLENWRRNSAYEAQQAAAKREEECAEIVRLNSRDNRRQLLHAYDLIQRHDMRVNR